MNPVVFYLHNFWTVFVSPFTTYVGKSYGFSIYSYS
jgi:hypothetical protein